MPQWQSLPCMCARGPPRLKISGGSCSRWGRLQVLPGKPHRGISATTRCGRGRFLVHPRLPPPPAEPRQTAAAEHKGPGSPALQQLSLQNLQTEPDLALGGQGRSPPWCLGPEPSLPAALPHRHPLWTRAGAGQLAGVPQQAVSFPVRKDECLSGAD